MFLSGWALKDISITVKVKTWQIANTYSHEFVVQIILHCKKSYSTRDPKGAKVAQKPYVSSGYTKFISTRTIAYFSGIISFRKWCSFSFLYTTIKLYYCAFALFIRETKQSEERKWENNIAFLTALQFFVCFIIREKCVDWV